MQAPSFTGGGEGRYSELGAAVEGNGAAPKGSGTGKNSNGTPAVRTTQSGKQSDGNRYDCPHFIYNYFHFQYSKFMYTVHVLYNAVLW